MAMSIEEYKMAQTDPTGREQLVAAQERNIRDMDFEQNPGNIKNPDPYSTPAPIIKTIDTKELEQKIVDIKKQLEVLRKERKDLDSAEPKFDNEADQLEYRREMLRAGAEAYMEYDPETATKWLQDAETMGLWGTGRGSATAAVAGQKLALTQNDIKIRQQMAEVIKKFRDLMASNKNVTLDGPEYFKAQSEVQHLAGGLSKVMTTNDLDKMFRQELQQEGSIRAQTLLEQADEKQMTSVEKDAYNAVKEQLGTVDSQFKDIATQMGKVWPALAGGASGKNAGAYASAVKSLIQAVDNSVVREGEMGLYNSNQLLNTVKSWIQGLVVGQKFTAADQERIWQSATIISDAVDKRLNDLKPEAMKIYVNRLTPELAGDEATVTRGENSIDGLLGTYRLGSIPAQPKFEDAFWDSSTEVAPAPKSTINSKWVGEAEAAGIPITSGIRDQATQDKMYAEAPADAQGVHRNALGYPVANISDHLTGNAIDVDSTLTPAQKTWLLSNGWSQPLADDPVHWVHGGTVNPPPPKPPKAKQEKAKKPSTEQPRQIGKFTVGVENVPR
jgi:hypothetical protein